MSSGSLLCAASPAAAAPGAIFTTDATGMVVNGNIYASKRAVYLNGGPPPNAPCRSAGLTDGDYYFQVTDPAGSVPLSSDAISERRVRVSEGVITSYVGTTHTTPPGVCPGAITVALFPYNDTPNSGGEYKVWMTPVASPTSAPRSGRRGMRVGQPREIAGGRSGNRRNSH